MRSKQLEMAIRNKSDLPRGSGGMKAADISSIQKKYLNSWIAY